MSPTGMWKLLCYLWMLVDSFREKAVEEVSSEQPADLLCLYIRWRAAAFYNVGKVHREKQEQRIQGDSTDLPPSWSVTGEATDMAVTAVALESMWKTFITPRRSTQQSAMLWLFLSPLLENMRSPNHSPAPSISLEDTGPKLKMVADHHLSCIILQLQRRE